MAGHLPNCIVIGAVKAGTSAIHEYLNLHPEITMSQLRELAFFTSTLNWHKGIEWYKPHWPEKNKIMGETSPQYTYAKDWREVPERISRIIPEAKIVYMVRDPIKRMISHYLHCIRNGNERRKLQDILTHEKMQDVWYVQCSMYHTQISHYMNYFPRPQIYIAVLEELQAYPQYAMKDFFKFLGVDHSFFREEFFAPVNVSSRKKRKTIVGKHIDNLRSNTAFSKVPIPPSVKKLYRLMTRRSLKYPILNDEIKQKLVNCFQREADGLRKLTGKKLEFWCC